MEQFQKALLVYSGGRAPAGHVLEACRQEFDRRGVICYGVRHGLAGLLFFGKRALTLLGSGSFSLGNPSPWRPKASFGRDGPRQDPKLSRQIVSLLLEEGFRYLVIYGGDGSANSAIALLEASHALHRGMAGPGTRLQIALLPKSIDNDLPVETLGHLTVVEYIGELLRNAARDARDSDRGWTIVEVPGRSAGWIAFRSAIQAEADMFLIPEQFPRTAYPNGVDLSFIVDVIRAGILKGLVGPRHRPYREPLELYGRMHGLVVVAEGLLDVIRNPPGNINRDIQGRPDYKSIQLHRELTKRVNEALEPIQRSLRCEFSTRGEVLGTTARGKTHNAADHEAALLLGTAVVGQLVDEGLSGIVPFYDRHRDRIGHTSLTSFLHSSAVRRISPRTVNLGGDSYRTFWWSCREGRLVPEDLASPEYVARLAKLAGSSPQEFAHRFHPIAEWGGRIPE